MPELDPAEVVHLDSAQLRTLAHPLRTRLLGALRLDGPSTASALAQRLGTNSGKTSYHLRQLASVGLVTEDAERGNARDRWWRAVHAFSSWSSAEIRSGPDDRAAHDWLSNNVARTHARWIGDWVAQRAEWPQRWQAAADLSDYPIRLTPDRLNALTTELHEVIRRYVATQESPESADAERVTVLLSCFPNPEPTL